MRWSGWLLVVWVGALVALLPGAGPLGIQAAFAQEIGEDADGGSLDDPPDEAGVDDFDPALGDAMYPEKDDDKQHDGVEEITVTATKRAQNIQDVPISITALGSDTIRDAGITQFTELQQFVPNLQIRPVTDTRSTSIRIRGIGSVGTNAGIDPSVGVFIDGVYQGRAGMSVQDLLDIERVEVLRGPQGTLYGKNTAAGAINVLTKRPSYEYETFLEGRIGNYNDMQFRGSVNAPIVEDRVAIRLSGYKVRRDGFDINRYNNQRVNDANQYGVRGKIAFDVTDSLSFELAGDFNEQNTVGVVADIIDYKQAGPSLSNVPFNALVAATGIPLALPADPFDRVVGANVVPKNIVRTGGVALDTNIAVGDHDIRWLNAWRMYTTDSRFDGDFSVYDAVLAFADVDLNQYSSELMITSPQWNRFEYQAGLYLYYMDMETLDRNGWEQGLVNAAALSGPLPALIFPVPTNNINQNEHETLSAAGYGEGTFSILDQLMLTGGLRVTYEEKWRVGLSQTTPPAAISAPPILGPTVYRNENRSVTNVQGRVVLRYEPTEDVMIYTSFANGFKSGGFNQLRVAAGTPSEFGDESSLTYELGAKTQWLDRQITANLTLYFTDYDDFQSQSFDGSSITVRNAGRLFSYGFESDVVYTPDWLDNFRVGLQVGLNIAEYDQFTGAENTVPNQVAITTAAVAPAPPPPALLFCGFTNCTQDLSGKVLDNAPRWTTTSFASYELPVAQLPVWWFARGDYTYTSEQYLAQDLDPNLLQPGYHLLNLRTGVRADDDLWEFTLWMTNVSNSNYLVMGIDVPIVSGYAGVPGPPRQYGGTVRIRF